VEYAVEATALNAPRGFDANDNEIQVHQCTRKIRTKESMSEKLKRKLRRESKKTASRDVQLKKPKMKTSTMVTIEELPEETPEKLQRVEETTIAEFPMEKPPVAIDIEEIMNRGQTDAAIAKVQMDTEEVLNSIQSVLRK